MTDKTAVQRFADAIAAEFEQDFELAAHEHGTFTLAIDCTGLYGMGTEWREVQLKAGGPQVVENDTMGGDPLVNTVKALFVPRGALVVVAAPPVASDPPAAPAPAPDAGKTPTPAPAPAPPTTSPVDPKPVTEPTPWSGPLLGICLPHLTFGADKLPGRANFEFAVPTDEDLRGWWADGFRLILLGWLWGRLQPTLGGDLDAAHAAIIADIVTRAKAIGFVVGLDNHSYGYHPAGGVNQGVVTSEQFADVSRRVAIAFPGVDIIKLMNEPTGDKNWEHSAHMAIPAVRAVRSDVWIIAGGANNSGPTDYFAPDIVGAKLLSGVHLYDDRYNSGNASTGDYNVAASSMVDRLKPWVAQARADGRVPFVDEAGFLGTPLGLQEGAALRDYCAAENIPLIIWAGYPSKNFGGDDYPYSVTRRSNGTPSAQMAVLNPTPAQAPSGKLTPATYADVVKLNPGYLPSVVSEATLASLSQHEEPGSTGEMIKDEGETGYRPEIGDRAYAAQLWALTMDPRARGHMLAQADLSKLSFPYHDRIVGQSQDGPPRPWLYTTERYGELRYEGRPIQVIADPNRSFGIHFDPAHAPAFVFDAAMCVGYEGNEAKFREYLTEMQYRVSNVIMNTTGPDVHGADALIVTWVGQAREHAWTLRDRDDLMLALEFMPTFGFKRTDDDEAWLSWLSSSMETNALMLNGVFNPDYPAFPTDLPEFIVGTSTYDTRTFMPSHSIKTGLLKNNAGIVTWFTEEYGHGDDGDTAIQTAWQIHFLNRIIMRLARRQHSSLTARGQQAWRDLAMFAGKFSVMVFGEMNKPDALDVRFADRYAFVLGKVSTGIFQTVAEFKAANDAKRATLDPADRNMYKHDDTALLEFPGSFANNATPALSDAVELRVPGAAEAWARFVSMKQIAQGADLSFSHAPAGFLWPVGGAASVGTPAPAPAPAAPVPAPVVASPASVDFDPATGTLLCGEGETTTMPVDGKLAYGADRRFFLRSFAKGATVAATNAVFGDPAVGAVKSLFFVGKPPATSPSGPSAPPAAQPPSAPATAPSPAPAAPASATSSLGGARKWSRIYITKNNGDPNTNSVELGLLEAFASADGSGPNLLVPGQFTFEHFVPGNSQQQLADGDPSTKYVSGQHAYIVCPMWIDIQWKVPTAVGSWKLTSATTGGAVHAPIEFGFLEGDDGMEWNIANRCATTWGDAQEAKVFPHVGTWSAPIASTNVPIAASWVKPKLSEVGNVGELPMVNTVGSSAAGLAIQGLAGDPFIQFNASAPYLEYADGGTTRHVVIVASSGHHPQGPNNNATCVIDLDALTYNWRNLPANGVMDTDPSGVDEGTGTKCPPWTGVIPYQMASGNFIQGHTYNTGVAIPPSMNNGHPGYAHDFAGALIVKNIDAVTGGQRFTQQAYSEGAGGRGVGPSASQAVWPGHGVFQQPLPSPFAYTAFFPISADGTVAPVDKSYPAIADGGTLMVIPEQNLLLAFSWGKLYLYERQNHTYYIGIIDLLDKSARNVDLIGSYPAKIDNGNDIDAGVGGMSVVWIPERQVAVVGNPSTYPTKLYEIIPPPGGRAKWLTDTWTCRRIPMSDPIRQADNPGSSSEIGFCWANAFDSLVITNSAVRNPQTVRLPDLGAQLRVSPGTAAPVSPGAKRT